MRQRSALFLAANLALLAIPFSASAAPADSACKAGDAMAGASVALPCGRDGGKSEALNGGSSRTEDVRMAGGSDNPADRVSGVWTATEIRETPIPAGSAVTLDFRDDLLVGASTCNIFKARILYPDGGVSFGPIEPRNKVCSKDLMDAEIGLFRALQRVTRFEIDGSGDLLLYAFETLQIRASR